MLTLRTSHRPDPVEGIGRAQRLRWRRDADRIVTDHRRHVTATLRALGGTPVSGLRAEPSGTLRVEFPAQTVTLAGIAASVVASAERLQGVPCHVAAAGAYGRFWWLMLDADPPSAFRLAVLGSHIRLALRPDPLEWSPAV